jgi:CrcB protein
MINALSVIIGGGIGAFLRYGVHRMMAFKIDGTFPWATLVINVTGAFLIGLLMTAFAGSLNARPGWRLFLIVGVLGGFTTFSALAWETYELIAAGNYLLGSTYVAATALGGACALIAGVWLGRLI